MNYRRLLFLTVALIIAIGTAIAARQWVAAERAAAYASLPKPVEKTVNSVLVAKAELAPGRFIKPSDLTWQPWPDDGLLDAYVVKGTAGDGNAKESGFKGAVVRSRVLPGQPVTRHSVVHPGERGFMAAVLTPGMRAVTVPVNATSGIAGFAFPGDKVDVIFALRLPTEGESKKKRLASQTLLRDVRVLAMDQVVENQDGKATVAKTSTLEVTPKQAEKIALALQMGSLSLSLRSLSKQMDDSTVPLFAASSAPARSAPSYTMDNDIIFMRRSGGAGQSINVLRGAKAETANF